MKRLLTYLKGYIKEIILAPLFKCLEACFELLVPLVVAQIVDVGIKNGDTPHIVKMVLIMVALGVIGLVCSITAQFFSARAAVGFGTKVRHSLFDHIQSFSYTELDKVGTSTLITRMTSDINQVQTGVNLVLRLVLRSPLVVFGAMIMAFTINVKAALIFCLIIPVLFVIVFLIMWITIPLYKKVQRKLDKVLGKTRENLAGTRVIRAFGKEEDEIEEYNKDNEELYKLQNKVGRIATLMNPMTYIAINIALVVLVYIGAKQTNAGIILQGQVIALVNYMSQILVELVKLANLIITINKSLASANRISDVLDMQSSMTDGAYEGRALNKNDENSENSQNIGNTVVDGQYMVEFDNVSLTYETSTEKSLENVSFKAKKGETIGIIGGIGSGKSTLINMIPRFYDATEGLVKIEGIDVKEYNSDILRDKIGIVPQKAVLFKGTIRDNIKWGNKEATDEEIYEALKASMAYEIVEKKEGKLDAVVEQGGKNLSGGQKQRLTIARALVKKPEILILDDSASALDYATEAALRKSIRELEYNPTVFIVSQRTSSIKHADQIIVLDDGLVAGIGTHEELLATCEVYKEIYASQYKGE